MSLMKYLDYIIQFWKEGEIKCFCASEIALYFFLAKECNRNFWNMPVACPTEYACSQLKLSKQGIMNARNTLAKRGLIDYDKGKRGTKAPLYTICELTNRLTNGLTNDLTNDLTNNLTNDLTNDLTNNKEEEPRTNSNTRKERKKERKSDREENNCHSYLPVSELKELLLADLDWQNDMIDLLAEQGYSFDINSFRGKLLAFFNMLEKYGIDKKEKTDCRQHAFNWIRKYCKTSNNDNSNWYDRRRATEGNAVSPKDYDQPF